MHRGSEISILTMFGSVDLGLVEVDLGFLFL